jgi:hypothetical protein
MNTQIDVHVLHLPFENPEWKDQCLEQLSLEPNINIHIVPGIFRDIKQSRINGYSMGTSEYVSYVDPDDLIEPGIFGKCQKVLDMNPHLVGVYTRSSIIDENANIIKDYMKPYREWRDHYMFQNYFEIHQLVVIRRKYSDIVNRQIELLAKEGRYTSDTYIEHLRYTLLSLLGRWKALPDLGYHWRSDGNAGRYNNGYSAKQIAEFHQLMSYLARRAAIR